jgi:cytochrome c oxidase assembly factor CtaG
MSPAHMVEHSALSVVVAPAIVLAWLALGLPRPRIGHPLLAWSAFVIAQWVFHLTPLLEESRSSPALHAAEHVAFLAAGVWFWAPVLGWRNQSKPPASHLAVGGSAPDARRSNHAPRLGDPQRSLYLFLATPAIDLVGAALIARGEEGAGVAMLAASMPIIAAAVAVTWQWLAREDREATMMEKAREAAG